ncbi:MAG: M1 family metallopeptidase [Flavobacteriales bacterium]|nr:M1 family metallopeptidase [Flavobacteriales bacterium]
MKIIIALLFACFFSGEIISQNHSHCQKKKHIPKLGGRMMEDEGNLRSDTLDILKYTINLDMTMMSSQQISGECIIDFRSKMDNIDWINLDLLALNVDSVLTAADEQLTFAHIGELLHVNLPMVLNENDEYTVRVFYHGSPVNDTSWGGFYFSSGYAYNLGVGFDADPHNYGRVWFPCFDNFVERSAYEFNVLTSDEKTAYCNGLRISVDTVGVDSLLTKWILDEEIPSYLASVAVGDYVHVAQSFESELGIDIPVWITAKAIDTTEAKASMINLLPALEYFEEDYGPYRFPRVGFTCVPFNGGAMEHATNISYPLFAIDGTLAWETLWAHELSHMWWGDLVTCHEAGEMWLNEGWARYSEALFTEDIYGHDEYLEYIRDNHKDVILHAHQQDGERFPVSPVPHEVTYGSHVYNKGADMVHCLRGYMGDEDFFEGVQNFLEDSAFTDITSAGLRDYLQQYTTADLNSFFDNWIFEPGYSEFRISHFGTDTGLLWDLGIEQHQHYATDLYENVPLLVTALGSNGQRKDTLMVFSGGNWSESIFLPDGFEPFAVFLNGDEKISQAVLGEEHTFTEVDDFDFDYAEFECEVINMGSSDSLWIRAENHLAEADFPHLIPATDYFISPDRWWRVDGNFSNDTEVNATIRYTGNGGTSDFDPLFFQYLEDNNMTEDSIVLLYRQREFDGGFPVAWQEWSNYIINTQGSDENWAGRIDIFDLQPGDYAWAVHTGVVGMEESTYSPSLLHWAADILTYMCNVETPITVFDARGRQVFSGTIGMDNPVSTTGWAGGNYVVAILGETHKIVVSR